jgi:hypothetical protein
VCIFKTKRAFHNTQIEGNFTTSHNMMKKMKFYFFLFLSFTCKEIFAQPNSDCRIDIYLVKNIIPCWDSVSKKIIPFKVTLNDLQDTAFIKDEEIVSYTFKKFKQKVRKGRKVTAKLHSFQTSSSLNKRIDSLNLSLFGCASQFAIVCNGNIVYSGCLNNHLSSWVPPTVFAAGRDNELTLNLWPGVAPYDPRENQTLFNCLKKSRRLKLMNTYDNQ